LGTVRFNIGPHDMASQKVGNALPRQASAEVKNMADIFSVKDKRVIVTGASRGLGRAIAEGFLQQGAYVLFVARAPTLEQQVRECGNDRARAVSVDLTTESAPQTVVTAAVSNFKGIDVLVNCAGVSLGGEDPYSDSNFDKTWEMNVRAAFRLSRAVATVMKGAGGSIINITSIGAEQGFPGNPGYVASKGGLSQLTKAMARDWAADNIRVNSVAPGYFKTEMTAKSFADSKLKAERDLRMILNRWGEPKDLVGPCVFLASEASGYITGCTLPVDGGWLAKGL
jgi:NAD(P)-dependent dehydrogenase (short-subunit alcohol dehydrogenase family)